MEQNKCLAGRLVGSFVCFISYITFDLSALPLEKLFFKIIFEDKPTSLISPTKFAVQDVIMTKVRSQC